MSCLAAMMNETCGCVWYRLKYNDQSVCDSENKSVGERSFSQFHSSAEYESIDSLSYK